MPNEITEEKIKQIHLGDTKQVIGEIQSTLRGLKLLTTTRRQDEPLPAYVRPSMERKQAILKLTEAILWLEKERGELGL